MELLEITEEQKDIWSLNNIQHFGIKLKAFREVKNTFPAERYILMDTDSYWVKDPRNLCNQIKPGKAVMMCDEGPIFGSRNASVSRFEQALANKIVRYSGSTYQLEKVSRMLNSSVLGIHDEDIETLDLAFELFSAIEPLVDAHTVEQFAVSESLRLNQVQINFCKNLTDNWSSSGKKNYVTVVLQDFFEKFGETNFDNHIEQWRKIRIRRPLHIILRQKMARLIDPQI